MNDNVWGHDLLLRWSPNLRFFDSRVPLLKDLADVVELQHLQLADSSAHFHVSDDMSVELSPAGMTVAHAVGRLEDDFIAICDVIDRHLSPSLVGASASTQHLLPLEWDYETATATSTRAWLQVTLPEGGAVQDCAVLLDGTFSLGHFQVEYGVLSAREVPARLHRNAGRRGAGGTRPANLAERLMADEVRPLPDVAVFADFGAWAQVPAGTGRGITSWTQTFLETSVGYASRLVDALRATVLTGHHDGTARQEVAT